MSAKVVVITGASGGIGAELARQLAARGEKLVLAARREAELKQVAAAFGADALTVVTERLWPGGCVGQQCRPRH